MLVICTGIRGRVSSSTLLLNSSKLRVTNLNLEKGALTCWWKAHLSELGDCFLITFSPLLQVGFLTTMAILLHEIPHEVRGLSVLPSWEITRVLHLLRGGLGLVNIFLSLWKLLPLGDWQHGKLETVLKHRSCYGWPLWLRMFIFINCQLLLFLGWRLCNPTSGWLWPLECSQDAAFHSSGGDSGSLLCNMCSVTKRSR